MSRYLEEAAEQLRKATAEYEQNCAESTLRRASRDALAEQRERIASGFAALAAIDKGLLPAEIAQDVIRAVIDRYTA
ncbi:hypothetical protein ACKI1J_14960 [Streptomyces scabiei]|uniref:hypothetical protein n=1 Tax=Streptomyces scabiei TaxID=1930 RepID=UPI00183DA2F7|nr:hypothetical protein [Streptomyces sp.]